MEASNPYSYSHGGQSHRQNSTQQPYPGYYQPPPSGDYSGYPPSESSNYHSHQPQAVQQYQYYQQPPVVETYPQPTNAAASPAPDAGKGLAEKFAGLLSSQQRRDSPSSSVTSSSSSSSSSSEDEGRVRKKKKKKYKPRKKPSFSHPPDSNPRDGPYPFSILTHPDDPENIVLTLSPTSTPCISHLTGPRHKNSQPAYKITWASDPTSRHNFMRHDLPSLSPSHPSWAGLGRADADGKVWFQFPWGDWGDQDYLEEFWASDVGFCTGAAGEDHWLLWSLVRDADADKNGRFTARSYDTTARGMPEVVRFEAEGEGRGQLVVGAREVTTVEMLDEVVVIALTVVKRMGDVIKGAQVAE